MAEYIEREAAVKAAKHAYNQWNLAMAAADGAREINLAYKRQELCKAVECVFIDAPAADVVPVGHGTCLMLPCQIGDIVYDCDFGMVNEWKIMGFSVGKVGLGVDAFGYSDDCEIVFYAEAVGHSAEMEFPQSSIGHDVFLVHEQAEKELDV